jgi:Flp pilus assembly protein TadD
MRRALALDPGNPAKLTSLGVGLLSLGERVDGLFQLREALRVDPHYEEAHYNIGVEVARDDPEEAERSFRTAREIDPHYALAHRELAHLLAGAKKFEEAEAHFVEAARLEPADPWTYVYWGTALWGVLDGAGAHDKYEQATRDRSMKQP